MFKGSEILSFPYFLIGIFAVANNLKALASFLNICKGLSPEEQIRLSRNATLASFIAMLVALFTGEAILSFFGISIAAFRIAGGIVLSLSGIAMLNSVPEPDDGSRPQPSSYSKVISLAIIPVAIPLTTGAGTFSTIILFADQVGHNWIKYIYLILAILVNTLFIYIVFRYSNKLLDILGHIGMNVLIRVVGLFTLAIGIQFIIFGLGSSFPVLKLTLLHS